MYCSAAAPSSAPTLRLCIRRVQKRHRGNRARHESTQVPLSVSIHTDREGTWRFHCNAKCFQSHRGRFCGLQIRNLRTRIMAAGFLCASLMDQEIFMNTKLLASTLLAASLLGAPAVAFAQSESAAPPH